MNGLETTVAVLADSTNEAAVDVLIHGLDSGHRLIQEGALRALLKRRSNAGQEELVRRWHTLSDRWKSIIAERPGRIAAGVRNAISAPDMRLCANGCDAVLRLHEFDLMPALLNVAEEKLNPHAGQVAETLVTLAELLYDELASPRDYRKRRDPQVVRQNVLASLERSVLRFSQHHRPEILEAFLVLANRDNLTLKQVLQNPYDSSYLAVIETLTNSPRPGVMRLLLNYLDDAQTPLSALNVLSHRRDVPFLRHLLRKLTGEVSSIAKDNLRRIEAIPWLQNESVLLTALNTAEQHAAVRLLVESGIQRKDVFEALGNILRSGPPAARREAAQALSAFRGAEANALVVELIHDSDPQVQAHLLTQLRDRGISGAVDMLLNAVDSPHDVVWKAVQQSLADFSFARFLQAFERLDEEVRRTTGLLVKKIDPVTIPCLLGEMESESRGRRLRGLEIATAIEVVVDVEQQVIHLLKDDDHIIRTFAAHALVASDSAAARQALHAALHDLHVSVRDAAESTLQRLDGLAEDSYDAAGPTSGTREAAAKLMDSVGVQLERMR